MRKMHSLHTVVRRFPLESVLSILEGIWNGIVVSGVLTLTTFLAKYTYQYLLS